MMRGYLSRRGGGMKRSSKENPVRAAGDGESNSTGKQVENKRRNLGNVKEVGVRGEGQCKVGIRDLVTFQL